MEARVFKAKCKSREEKRKLKVVFTKWIPLPSEQMRNLWFEDGVRPCCWVRYDLAAWGLGTIKVTGDPPPT